MTFGPLDYATGPHRRPHARLWRRVVRPLLTRRAAVTIVVTLAMAAVFVSYRWPWVWYGSKRAYDWHRMLTLELPPDQVAYEEDPDRVQSLLARPPERRFRNLYYPDWRVNRDYRWYYWKFSEGPRRIVGFSPGFYQPQYWLGSDNNLVFMHECVGTMGIHRLVWVYSNIIYGAQSFPRKGIRISAQSHPASQSFSFGEPRKRHLLRGLTIPLNADEFLRLYVGQLDPNDNAHFTVKYEINNVPGTIDGRLETDDTVTLRIVSGPATTRPSNDP